MKNTNVLYLNETKSFLNEYKFNYLYSCEVIKTKYFAPNEEMDWLVGNWIFASADRLEKNINKVSDILVPAIYATNENSIKLIQKYWPLKVKINGQKYNVLPVSNERVKIYNYSKIKKWITHELLKIDEEEYFTDTYLNAWFLDTKENIKNLKKISNFIFEINPEIEYNQIVLN